MNGLLLIVKWEIFILIALLLIVFISLQAYNIMMLFIYPTAFNDADVFNTEKLPVN